MKLSNTAPIRSVAVRSEERERTRTRRHKTDLPHDFYYARRFPALVQASTKRRVRREVSTKCSKSRALSSSSVLKVPVKSHISIASELSAMRRIRSVLQNKSKSFRRKKWLRARGERKGSKESASDKNNSSTYSQQNETSNGHLDPLFSHSPPPFRPCNPFESRRMLERKNIRLNEGIPYEVAQSGERKPSKEKWLSESTFVVPCASYAKKSIENSAYINSPLSNNIEGSLLGSKKRSPKHADFMSGFAKELTDLGSMPTAPTTTLKRRH